MFTLYMIACASQQKKSLASCIRNDKMSLLFVKREWEKRLYVNVYLSNNRPKISWTNTQCLQVAIFIRFAFVRWWVVWIRFFCVPVAFSTSLSLFLFLAGFVRYFCPSFQRFESWSQYTLIFWTCLMFWYYVYISPTCLTNRIRFVSFYSWF